MRNGNENFTTNLQFLKGILRRSVLSFVAWGMPREGIWGKVFVPSINRQKRCFRRPWRWCISFPAWPLCTPRKLVFGILVGNRPKGCGGETNPLSSRDRGPVPSDSIAPCRARGVGRGENASFEIGPKTGDWLGKLVMPYGHVSDVYVSPTPNAPMVVHIQDAHGIGEAQKNISAMVGVLQSERHINLVGLEGASGSFSVATASPYCLARRYGSRREIFP